MVGFAATPAHAITVDTRDGPVALRGVDAPDPGQICAIAGADYDCGIRSQRALADRIADRDVTCELLNRDHDGVVDGICYAAGEELNSWMVANGWAVADRDLVPLYAAQETQARRFGLGLWRGEFERPAAWRLRAAQQATEDPSMANMIKIAVSGSAARPVHWLLHRRHGRRHP